MSGTNMQVQEQQVDQQPVPQNQGILSDVPPMDIDEQRLADAIREAEAEEAAALAAQNQQQAPAPVEEQPQPQEPTEEEKAALPAGSVPTQQQKPAGIPKQRLDQVLNEKRAADQRVAELEASQAMLARLAASGQLTPEIAATILGGKAEAEPTPADQYQQLKENLIALSERFDAGEIGMKEFKQHEMEIQDQMTQLRSKAFDEGQVKQVQNSVADTTTAIERDFPIIGEINQAQLDSCVPLGRQLAERQLAQHGITFDPAHNPKHLNLMHWHIANVADKTFGEGKGPLSQQQRQQTPAPASLGAAGRPANGQQQPVSKGAAAAKIAMAANHAPDLTNMTQRPDGLQFENLAARIPTMTTEEIAALPKSVLAQFTGEKVT